MNQILIHSVEKINDNIQRQIFHNFQKPERVEAHLLQHC